MAAPAGPGRRYRRNLRPKRPQVVFFANSDARSRSRPWHRNHRKYMTIGLSKKQIVLPGLACAADRMKSKFRE
jgi:hypothetical protein